MILTLCESAGVSILNQVQRCAHRGIAQGRPLKIAVAPQAWDSLLNFYESHPMRLRESKDGRTARIVLFVEGLAVEVGADASITEFCQQEWINE